MLVKLQNNLPVEWPVTEAHIQATNPNTSFAFPLSKEILLEFGYATLQHTDPMDFDSEFKKTVETAPKLIDGVCIQQWEIVDKYSSEEKAQYLLEKANAAKTAYQRQRAAEYPPVADYLDGLVKGDQVQMQAYIDACLAVKAKYPKE